MSNREEKEKKQNEEEDIYGSADNYVFHNNGGTIMSGGFEINSKALTGGNSIMMSGGTNIMSNFAIPASLYLSSSNKKISKSKTKISNKDEVLDDSIYDRLLKMAEYSGSKKRKTRKEPIARKKKTRKNN